MKKDPVLLNIFIRFKLWKSRCSGLNQNLGRELKALMEHILLPPITIAGTYVDLQRTVINACSKVHASLSIAYNLYVDQQLYHMLCTR